MLGWACGTDCTARSRSRWELLVASVLFSLLVSPASAFASDSTPVYFAGFAYIGDDAAVAASYPLTRAVETESTGGVSVLDAELRKHVASIANPSFSLVFDQLASLKPGEGSAVVLAFAVDRETTSVEQIGDKFKLLTELSAQALFVDFREMVVVASYPVVVQAVDLKDAVPTDDERRQAVRNLYLKPGKANVFSAFATALATLKLNPSVSRRLRVTEATVSESARAVLAGTTNGDPGVIEQMLAQDFSKFLSANQRIPVLPPSKGHAIGNRMATRFADGRVFNLQIPEADYTVSLNLDELRRIDYGGNAAGRSFIYGAFLTVRVAEPLSGRAYFDARLRNGATKTVPASQVNVDDAAAFQDSLQSLMDKFTTALDDPQPAWAEKHAGDRAVVKQMQELAKVLKSCR